MSQGFLGDVVIVQPDVAMNPRLQRFAAIGNFLDQAHFGIEGDNAGLIAGTHLRQIFLSRRLGRIQLVDIVHTA